MQGVAKVRVDHDSYRVLVGYRYALLELRALETQYERLLYVGGPSIPAMTGVYPQARVTNDKDSARIQAQDGVLRRMDAVRGAIARRVDAFEAALASVRDDRTRCVLRYYYGCGYSNEQVAAEMGISEKTAIRCRLDYFA